MNEKKDAINQVLHESYLDCIGTWDNTNLMLTHDDDAVSDLLYIYKIVNKIIKSNANHFSLEKRTRIGSYQIKMTSLGKEIVGAINRAFDYIHKQLNSHKFHPYIELFLALIKKTRIKLFVDMRIRCNEKYTKKCIQHLNNFICKIKNQHSTGRLSVSVNKFQRSARKNHTSLIRYTNNLFEKHARLLIIRVDFGYLSECKNKITTDMVLEHRKKFFTNTRSNQLFTHMLGYAWKLEYGLDKGFHYHMLFMFDGSKVREDISIAKQLGEYWSSSITNGDGLYFNCNRIKDSYKCCGIGMVNHDDSGLRDGLNKAALYMTKADDYIKLVLPDKSRIFGRGEISRPKLVRRGRPRRLSSSNNP